MPSDFHVFLIICLTCPELISSSVFISLVETCHLALTVSTGCIMNFAILPAKALAKVVKNKLSYFSIYDGLDSDIY